MLETNTLKKMKRFTAIPKSLIIVTGDVGYGCLTPLSTIFKYKKYRKGQF
jgi:Tfp pilus assembly pilus retraction ATPase PilT